MYELWAFSHVEHKKKNFAEDKCSWKSFDKNISSDYDWTKFSSEI